MLGIRRGGQAPSSWGGGMALKGAVGRGPALNEWRFPKLYGGLGGDHHLATRASPALGICSSFLLGIYTAFKSTITEG